MSEADPPSNLWQDLLDKATRADGAGNCSLLVVGDVGAGKRGLVRALQARAAGALVRAAVWVSLGVSASLRRSPQGR